ncbi:hypothetical protein [Vannielia litorea]|uniref:hypothetical protein n=1 Tax=Vannielia litorea TaxID=1217970 RepID=UPI001C97FBD9|nr:hypothetical protein [Vannielia litorea]MBY6046246.1 hypothetical protein [Vannielia litorea]MBY6073659.1 hypothetical protein [Vannielia litorea]
MKFLSIAILLCFGFGTAGLVAHLWQPHWAWLVAAYVVGSWIGLAVMWLVYMLPPLQQKPITQAQQSKAVKTGS